MDNQPQQGFGAVEGVILLDHIFFLDKKLIRQNTDVVKRAFAELYRYSSNN